MCRREACREGVTCAHEWQPGLRVPRLPGGAPEGQRSALAAPRVRGANLVPGAPFPTKGLGPSDRAQERCRKAGKSPFVPWCPVCGMTDEGRSGNPPFSSSALSHLANRFLWKSQTSDVTCRSHGGAFVCFSCVLPSPHFCSGNDMGDHSPHTCCMCPYRKAYPCTRTCPNVRT